MEEGPQNQGGGAEPGAAGLRPFLLGEGWFPDHPGGLNRYFSELYVALRRAGVDATGVVVGPVSEPPPGLIVAADRAGSLPRRALRFTAAARRAGSGADVVDAHFALYAYPSVVFGRLGKVPLVVHFHGPWAEESAAGGERSSLALGLKRTVERAVYHRAGRVVVLSGAFERVVAERYGVAPWDVQIVPPGVDAERFSPGDRGEARAKLGVGSSVRLAFAARRLVPRMGIDVLLEAWSSIAGDGDDTDHAEQTLLVVAGEGPARAGLEDTVRSLGVDGSVRFVGRVGEEELVEWYRAADVCVVPSTSLEGFGLTVLEALACGTPVVATDVGGLPEALAGFDDSLLVPPGDVAALADRLSGAFDGTRPLPTPERCRQHAEGFSWDNAVDRHLRIYDEVAHPPAERRLRVVYLDHVARLSGAELALLRLLPAMDVDAHVIVAEDGPLVARLRAAGISVEVLPMAPSALDLHRDEVRPGRIPLSSAMATAGYVVRLARRLRWLRPDLVHANSLKSALCGLAAGRIAGVPLVWHLRDRIAKDYLPGSAVRLVRSAASRFPTAVIANSHATLDTLDRAGRRGRLPGGAHVIGDAFRPIRRPPPLGGRRMRMGMVGRLAPWKGQHVFLDAFARAFAGGSEQAVVVGAPLFGEEHYAAELRQLATRLGIAKQVEFTGFRDDVEAELARFELLVHASTIPEPFGQVVIEGMAAGLPVVAANAGGPAEIIEHEVNGLLYPPGDAAALADVLRRLAADPNLRWRLGWAGRSGVAAYAPEVIAAQVMSVYRQALAGRRAPPSARADG